MIKLDLNPEPQQLRVFGWIGLVAFPLAGALMHFYQGWIPQWAFWVLLGLGAACGLLALAQPKLLKPLFIGMTLIAYPIGLVISTVLIGLIYYGLFTPVGLLFKLMGRDMLHRKLDRNAASYWVERKEQRTPASYLRMY